MDELEERMNACERFNSWAMGVGGAVVFLLGLATPFVLKLL